MFQSQKKKLTGLPNPVVLVTDEALLNALRAAFEGLSLPPVAFDFILADDVAPEFSEHNGLTVFFGNIPDEAILFDIAVSGRPTDDTLPTIGYQRHLTDPDAHQSLYKLCPLSLGGLRDTPELIEPLTRDASAVMVSSDCIRRSDSGIGSVTGMTVEEACQVTRSLGESQLLTYVFFEVPRDSYPPEWIHCCAAQLWYLGEGIRVGQGRNEKDFADMQQILVPLPHTNVQLVRSVDTGRLWWATAEGYVAIHESEYASIKEGHLPARLDRWLY